MLCFLSLWLHALCLISTTCAILPLYYNCCISDAQFLCVLTLCVCLSTLWCTPSASTASWSFLSCLWVLLWYLAVTLASSLVQSWSDCNTSVFYNLFHYSVLLSNAIVKEPTRLKPESKTDIGWQFKDGFNNSGNNSNRATRQMIDGTEPPGKRQRLKQRIICQKV